MSTSGQGTDLRVCLPVPAHAIMAHLLLTDPLGYAEEEGLRLSFDIVDGPDIAVAGAGEGRYDVAVANAVFAFRMRERGAAVRAFYSTCRGVYRSFAVPVDSPISSLADLRGRRIGTDFPDLLDLAFPTLRDEGLRPEEDVTFLPRSIPIPGVAPSPEELERIASGKLDAIWVLACAYEMLLVEGAQLRRLPTRTLDRLTPSELLYAGEHMLAGNSEALARFGRAVAKASLFCDTDPEAAVRLVWEHFPEARPAAGDEAQALKRDVAGLRGRTERGLPQHGRVPAWGSITAEEIQQWEDFLLRNGGIGERHPLEEYFEPGLVDAFNDFDADAVRAQARAAGQG
ncbi:ABC transporter substrate-binding protein (plasmid) [Pseudonocardia bannensis]|uniref:ABC transporter substrate-binding protein n=2 Tax=Pseudonocardia TaxID=1847 RepID=A0A848DNS8_9PSEU|nr:ABC transporter substrate-binding protein [Pseudonocardia bannensis]NMH94169.1 ABC transporter substrate-binding protein [Pseudonocardia bannensis]